MRAPRASFFQMLSSRHAAAACGWQKYMMAGRERAHFLVSVLYPLNRIGKFPLSSCHLVVIHARIQAPPSSFRIQRYACVSSASGSYQPTGDEEEFFLSISLFERTSFFSKSGRYLYSREKEGTSYLVGSAAQLHCCCKCSSGWEKQEAVYFGVVFIGYHRGQSNWPESQTY